MVEGNLFELFRKSFSDEIECESICDFEDINHINNNNNNNFIEISDTEKFSFSDHNHPTQTQIAHNNQNVYEYKSKPKIFKITKSFKKRIKKRTSLILSINNSDIPKEKHLNVEKKKNRIQFQINHKKTIYSYCHLEPPVDFFELFNLVKEHQANHKFLPKSQGEGQIRSFHFIRDKKTKEVRIVTFQEKQEIKRIQKNKEKI